MRRLTAALLLLNLLQLTWLALGDFTGQNEREPGRVDQQLNPDNVQVLPDSAASGTGTSSLPNSARGGAAAPATASVSSNEALTVSTKAAAAAVAAGVGASTAAGGQGAVSGAVTALNAVCLEAGPFDTQALPAAEAALAELPKGSWRKQTLMPAPAYLVYLGRLSDQKTAQRRMEELRKQGVRAELARDLPALEPGLVFSRHAQAAQAEAALAELQAARSSLRQARVASTSEAAAVVLRVEHPTDEVRSMIAGIEATAALRGGFRGCRKPAKG
jgi:hypothetical protein